MTSEPSVDKVRLDRWLWAARFYKTRSVAADAIDGGKVQVSGTRVKRSKLVEVGDQLRIRKPPYEFLVTVRQLSEHRGPAKVAQTLYEESQESVHARERLRAQLTHQPVAAYEGKGRPTKKDRRQIDRLKRGH
ncbi:MAG: RNA-binding S4 domain-containing protein [Gemmatimonadota bacterium]|nr:MAG: RNA-binding S4 domain-containing protein [Gemmatimonadota bacterium]